MLWRKEACDDQKENIGVVNFTSLDVIGYMIFQKLIGDYLANDERCRKVTVAIKLEEYEFSNGIFTFDLGLF